MIEAHARNHVRLARCGRNMAMDSNEITGTRYVFTRKG